ncbi:MAG TPA: M14 family zinc carboxypeptidase [Bacteroidota bacterium]|nr:M14 family zinc carboxypeptidase [Bacteroidota bacterium]
MAHRRFLALLIILCWTFPQGAAQIHSPVERRAFKALTSYTELQQFLGTVNGLPGIAVRHVARTKHGRNVSLVTVTSSPRPGSDTSKLRVMLFAQQHGDEPSGKEAMAVLLAKAARGELRQILEKVDLLVIPQMNPDGSELRQRRTADSVDLNRNHVLLTSPETKALHDVFFQWLPEVTVDIHEYGSFSKDWSDYGFIKTADVQLGMLTNLNTSPAIADLQHRYISPFLAEHIKKKGYSFHEYIVGTPQEYIRHSTTEINDGRQSFGILGSVSFIQEGRKWSTLEDQLRRRALSQLAAVEALLEYCAAHAAELKRIVSEERASLVRRAGHPVVIRMDHFAGNAEMVIPVRRIRDGMDTTWRITDYRSEVRPQMSVSLPRYYIIERADSEIVALLRRHHVAIDTLRSDTTLQATVYQVESLRNVVLEGDSVREAFTTPCSTIATLKPGDYLVSTAQLQALFLGIVLEPQSQWGLVKYDHFAHLYNRQYYPIRRIP